MSDDKQYTSDVAQVIDATGDAVKGTNPFLVYYIVMVLALLGVMYFVFNMTTNHFSRIEDGLSNNHADLQKIDNDLNQVVDILQDIQYERGLVKPRH